MSAPHIAVESNHFAVLTDRGPAAIAVVWLRGPAVGSFVRDGLRMSGDVANRCSGRFVRAQLLDGPEPLDDILVSFHRDAPDWDIRLHLHGGPGIVRRCVEMLAERGFRESSDPSRSLWDAKSRIEAEAFELLPSMSTLAGAQWLSGQARELESALLALRDESDFDKARAGCRALLGRPRVIDWFASPLRVALAGPPNAGKSSLANALSDRPASLVSSIPGTTRDWLEIPAEIRGYPVRWLDTAGIRPAADALEVAGIRRTHEVLAGADAILLVLDGSPGAAAVQTEFAKHFSDVQPACVIVNKRDQMEPADDEPLVVRTARQWSAPIIRVSATERLGLDSLIYGLLEALGRDAASVRGASLFTERQAQLLMRAMDSDREVFRTLLGEAVCDV